MGHFIVNCGCPEVKSCVAATVMYELVFRRHCDVCKLKLDHFQCGIVYVWLGCRYIRP